MYSLTNQQTLQEVNMDDVYDAIIDIVDQQALDICKKSKCQLLIVDYVDGYPVPACYATKKRNGIGYTYHYFEKQEDCPRLRQYPRMCQSCKEYECPKTKIEISECKKINIWHCIKQLLILIKSWFKNNER